VALAHRRAGRRPDGHDSPAPGPHLHLAAHAAVGTGRPRPAGRPARREDGVVLQRAAGAGVDAGPAGDAVAVPEAAPFAGDHPCAIAARPHVPDELSLHLLADAHAAVALDALGHVHVQVRVGGVDLRRVGGAAALALQAVALEEPVQRLLRRPLDRARGVAPREQPKRAAPRVLDLRALRGDDHAFHERRGAGGHRARLALDVNQAHPADAVGAESLVLAQRRHVQAQRASGLEDRHVPRELVRDAVDDGVGHATASRSGARTLDSTMDPDKAPEVRPLLSGQGQDSGRLGTLGLGHGGRPAPCGAPPARCAPPPPPAPSA